MSGHSHWAGIKHKKAANDAKRGKLWSKLARLIIVAAKNGGGDPGANLSLRYAIEKAKEANMPKDTIEKAIKKGTGDLEGVSFEEVLYEGYGPGGVAIMCEVLTDNRNRTAGEIRKIFDMNGGALGATGCVAWIFSKKGFISINGAGKDEEKLMELALEAGAEDFSVEEGMFEITTDAESFRDVKQALIDAGFEIDNSEISQVPSNTIAVDENDARKIMKLMEKLEDHDDVQGSHGNFDISDEIMEKLQ
ncbi:MAG: YebC/PmpR family DNA-binding transcriptional regulator [Sedimentisphaerales bacterium]|nr:YebC/PmpR family DNA-binding transcriptional regulator [Sedimentisphaerales bacterium]MBN2843418.1 YebC/PmpR family DNA-binding transcriptional regulator [Sedimentisphaerales bacterium]